jgi:N-acetylmuramoyl-L-alanine amidase
MKVILDNGHGKDTPGKRSPIWADGSQLMEWKFNREIVAIIHKTLQSSGIESVIIVPEEHDVPLQERVNRANLIYKDDKNSFLISVHGNAGGGSGFEVFTSVGQTESDIIAQFFAIECIKVIPHLRFRSDETDKDKDKEENFYILKHTNCPAILTENGFMDNLNDCKFMLSNHGQFLIAKAHIIAIIRYLQLKK